MTPILRAYPTTRESGIPWPERIPRHWEVLPAHTGLAPKLVRNIGLKETRVLSLSFGRIIVKPSERLHGLVPESFETYQIVAPGDIIVRATDLQNDQTSLRVAIVRDAGIITSAYLCLTPKGKLHPEFAYWLLHAFDISKMIYRLGSGLRQNLDFADFKRLPIPVPPMVEQESIAGFCHYFDVKVARLIRNKRRLIALLNEEKQAIIQQAVTRGLDPDVATKPSGVEWLGEIPAHLFFGQLRRYWEVADCKHLTVPFVDDGIPLASVSEVRGFELNLSQSKKTTSEWYEHLVAGNRKPKRDDLVYCRNVSVGSCALVNTDEVFALGQDVCLIRSNQQNQRFLNYLLHSPFMDYQLSRLLVGSTFKRINVSQILALQVLVPPRREQDRISAWLDTRTSEFDKTIARIEKEIDLIREYRTRLIADVVTGQLDVREAAAALPDIEEEESGAALDIGEAMEEDEGFADDEFDPIENADAAD